MIEIDDKIVSADLLRDCFACDLAACKGICCVEGNAGAPLETDEVDTLEEEYPNYKPYMTPEGIRAVEAQGFMVVDEDGDYTTPLVDDAECAYACTEEGITFCAIEKAFREGKTTFRKPISCHLYPIRLMNFSNGTVGLNYHRWSICEPENGSGSRCTRRFGSRSSVASAKSSTKRSKLRNNCSRINRETTTRNEKPTYHRCRLAAAHHDGSGTGPPYGDDPGHR